jgi:hypothetical protein
MKIQPRAFLPDTRFLWTMLIVHEQSNANYKRLRAMPATVSVSETLDCYFCTFHQGCLGAKMSFHDSCPAGEKSPKS